MWTDIKNKTIDIWVWTLVGIISSLITTTVLWSMVYTNLEKRISFLEFRQEQKANKEDLKIIEVKLASIEKGILELKAKLQ